MYNNTCISVVSPKSRHGIDTLSEWFELLGSFSNNLLKSIRALQSNFVELGNVVDCRIYDTLRIVYRSLVVESKVDQRLAFFEHVLEQVEEVEMDAAALKVFIQFEPNNVIVNRAVQAYLQLRQANREDPFVAVHDILGLVSSGNIVNRGAVFAALVCFGVGVFAAIHFLIMGLSHVLRPREWCGFLPTCAAEERPARSSTGC